MRGLQLRQQQKRLICHLLIAIKDLGNGIKSKGGFTIQYIPGLDPNGEALIEGDAPRTYPIADGEAVTYMQGRFLTQMRALGLSTGKSFVEETSGAKNRPAQR